MTSTETTDKLNTIKRAGVVLISTRIPLKEANIHISLDGEEGGKVVYNPYTCPVSQWLERVYNAMKACGLIN